MFIPYRECSDGNVDCFKIGRCLRDCAHKVKPGFESRLEKLEKTVADLVEGLRLVGDSERAK